MSFVEQVTFLRQWASDPLRVGAVAPSGPQLCDLITREITAGHAPVIELGPGTGVFTQRLIDRGVAEEDLALVERGEEFAEMLRRRFPAARILRMNAGDLYREDLFAGRRAGAVVSGLPLVSMSKRQVMGIMRGAFAHLREDGHFYQFTYGLICPVPKSVLDRCGLEARRIGGTLINVPPAAVYRISRRSLVM